MKGEKIERKSTKKIKKITSLTDEEKQELPQIPNDWIWVSHSEIATINPSKPDGDESTEVSFLPMAAVEEETGHYSLSDIRNLGEVKKGYTGFITGDIIFAKITPCMENGKIALLGRLVNGIGFGSTEFHVSRPRTNIEGSYLYYNFLQKSFRKKARRNMTGTAGQLRVPTKFFAEQPIPICSVPEQRAIVSKIEQLFSELDNGIANLKQAQEQLKVYRQAVLKKAFEGELSRKWRVVHNNKIEISSDLLNRILDKPQDNMNIDEYSPLDSKELHDIPNTWRWITLNDICDIKPGGTPSRSKPEYWGGDIAWVSSGEVKNSNIYDTKEKITELGVINSNAKINPPGTILLAMIGEGKTRGQVGLLKIHAATNQNVAAIKPITDDINPKILFYWFTANYEINRKMGSGGMQKALNARIIKHMSFPLIPYNEQIEIISEIGRLFSNIQISESIIKNVENMSINLRQSILKQAFNGKLLRDCELEEVHTSPDWEPAEELLKRIKSEES